MPLPVIAGVGALGAFIAKLAGMSRAVFTGGSAVWAMILATAPKWVPYVVTTVLLTIGLKFVAIDPAIDAIANQVRTDFGLLSATALEVLYYLNVDDYVSMILSALGAAATGKIALRRVTQ
jgi:hypothetical protein